ncbi:MAG: Fur family transcriptional regulator [Trueperaceae bacterium]
MSHHTWKYQDALRAQGFRVTPQRELVMDLICDARTRPTAQDLLAAAHATGASVDAATVYRNLRFLCERGLIRSVERDGVVGYELAGPRSSHHHLACRACGREFEVGVDASDGFFAEVLARTGFRVTSDHLVLTGFCAACGAAEQG